jgi:hypothetical protein
MLNGIEPIIIFNFFKATPATIASLQKIPVVADVVESIGLPPIPIYLSEKATGILIVSEDKNIDLQTSTETLTSGTDPKVDQKGISSTVRINIEASRKSLGVTLLSAMADLLFKKATSKEYSITYLHGAVTVFGGLLESFQISQNADNDLYNISITLSRSGVKTQETASVPVVNPVVGAVPL